MIWLLLWLLIGYLSVAYVAYNEAMLGKEPITLNHLTKLAALGLLGPIVACLIIGLTIHEFYEVHGDTVIFGKKEKE